MDNATSQGGDFAKRPVWRAIGRGFRRKCPRCGNGHLFQGYLRAGGACSHCGLSFDGHQADDAPPFMTIILVGHLLAIPYVEVQRHLEPPVEVQLFGWMGIALALSLFFLPRVKGSLIGIQWANRMHGFGAPGDRDPEDSLRSTPSDP